MINLTPSAVSRINQLRTEEAKPAEAPLRVFVKKGGCSGFSYKLEFDDSEVKANDKLFESEGQRIVVDTQSLLYVLGLTLDYEGGLNGKGLIFKNPNAKETCSCGVSFGV